MAYPCCPDCQTTGLAIGQASGWWGRPFDDGINTEAAIFWGDECCPECAWCPICQGD